MRSDTVVLAGERPATEDHVASVYRYAVRAGAIETVQRAADTLGLELAEAGRAITQLVESRLLREERGGPHQFVPVDPEIAAALLVSPMEREIYQRRELIAQIRQRTEMFRQDYSRTGGLTSEFTAIENVVGSMEVRGYLKLAGDACRGTIMLLLSGKQDAEDFDDFHQVCSTLLDRGVRVRIVCGHRNRADLTTRTKIKNLTAAGAEVRTVTHVPRTAVVMDRSLAILLGADDSGETTASRVRNGEVVEFLLDVFDHLWDVATPLDSFETGYADVADDLRQTIAGLMAKGFTDEVLARKLGMSLRTCRRHIAALMRDLDAVSRFQAGVQAARRSLVDHG
ncbi:hypothetical protein [Actinokineospora xionganensis]|uniref:HTH luxR-type domain-containing protein n=1 Tax=Actinokineospora xionganensis TaxID=2684470 RepID=A0ABR7L4R1_9PSEU|nr:hypothetical protein [Actinokineospora xionganensis]MBC6447381.1 hypothetical protein [Actinokineospora xionganensis]